MADVFVVAMRATLLSASALAGALDQHGRPCYTHAATRAGWHCLVGLSALALAAAVYRCRGGRHGYLRFHQAPGYTAAGRTPRWGKREGGALVTIHEEGESPCDEEQLAPELHPDAPPTPANHAFAEHGWRGVLLGPSLGLLCFVSAAVLQFHDDVGPTILGACFLAVSIAHPNATYLSGAYGALSVAACVLLLLDSFQAWAMALAPTDLALAVAVPAFLPAALHACAGSTDASAALSRGAPTLLLLSIAACLAGWAADDPCSIDVVSEWEGVTGAPRQRPGSMPVTGGGVPPLLHAVWPALTMVSLHTVLRGASRPAEVGSLVVTACSCRYLFQARDTPEHSVRVQVGMASVILSLGSVLCVMAERACSHPNVNPS